MTGAIRATVVRGLRDRSRSVLTWGGSVAAMCALTAALWPSIEDSIGKAVRDYPKGLKEAFGITELTSVEQYLSAEVFSLIVPVAIAFFAIRSVVRSLPAAEESGQLNVLLSAPLSRDRLVGATLLTTALVVAAALLVVGAVTWLAALVAGSDLSARAAAEGTANVWPLSMFFAGAATLATGLTGRSARVTGATAALLVGMYVLDLLGKLADPMEPLRNLSVFKFYGTAIEDGIDPVAFAGITACGVLLALAGAALFRRRDLLG